MVGAAAFYGGMQYQKSNRGNFSQFPGQNRNGQIQRRFNGNSQAVRGEIINADDKSITVKLPDGSSKIAFLSDTTTITEATSAARTELQTGKQVVIFGNNNSDGSVAAQNIQLNPQQRQTNSGV